MEDKNPKMDLERLVSTLRGKEPVLVDPERLTEDIMNAIRMKAGEAGKPHLPVKRPGRPLVILTRLLAAASVCLFLLFGYEQYVVVDKIGRLERQNANISRNNHYIAAIKINEVIALLKSDPKFLNHYKNLEKENTRKLDLLKAAVFFDLIIIAGNDSTPQNHLK